MPANDTTLTARQRLVLAFAVAHFRDHQRFPVIRDFMARFGWSGPQGVVHHLKALVRKGYLTRTPKVTRGYKLVGVDEAVRRAAVEYLERLQAMEVKE